MLVRVHDIGMYLRCPMLVYLDLMGKIERKEDVKRTVLRHLALYSDPRDISGDLSKTRQDIISIYKLSEADVSSCIDDHSLISKIASIPRDLITPCEVEVELRSERLGLSGLLDRLVKPKDCHGILRIFNREEIIPSIVRTGRPPAEGVWRRDRIQLAAYALLLEDRFGKGVSTGQVEYVREAYVRRVRIRSIDRSRALWIRDRVREIIEGQMPDVRNAPCESCNMVEACRVKSCVASSML